MQAKNRHIKTGKEFDRYFNAPLWRTVTLKRKADLSDTLQSIPKIVSKTLDQTKAIAYQLKGVDAYVTCSNLWHFIYENIGYAPDKKRNGATS